MKQVGEEWKGVVEEYATLGHLSKADRTADEGDADLVGR